MSDLYDADVLEWSEHQARLLQQHATGKLGNEVPGWANIIEEIKSVGSEQLHAVEGNLVQVLVYDLRCEAWPLSSYVPHWRAEARTFRSNARRCFTNSMRRRIDVASLYADALDGLPETIDGHPPLPVDSVCRATVDELLQRER